MRHDNDLTPLDGMDAIAVDEFAEFWHVFPRHRDRFRAVVAYRRARQLASRPAILAAAERYADEVAGIPENGIQIATSWLAHTVFPEPAEIAPSAPSQMGSAGRTIPHSPPARCSRGHRMITERHCEIGCLIPAPIERGSETRLAS